MSEGINITLNDTPQKRGSWKKKLALYCFLLIAGFAVGYFYDIKSFKDTVLDKEKIVADFQAKNALLEKQIDSLGQVEVKVKERIRFKIKQVEKYTDEEIEDFFNNRYKE